ncbi:unnamed protein product [Closterium sp. Yama58-4]|nr:unnamed protein product [Closterium sp. Yama58-4]
MKRKLSQISKVKPKADHGQSAELDTSADDPSREFFHSEDSPREAAGGTPAAGSAVVLKSALKGGKGGEKGGKDGVGKGKGKAVGFAEADQGEEGGEAELRTGAREVRLPTVAEGAGADSAEPGGLLDRFTPEQMNRYEAYRRSGFKQASMRRLVHGVAGSTVSPQLGIVMAGVAKLMVGELVETARLVMGERGDEGPIRPTHIREAYRRLKMEKRVPVRSRPPLFR